MTVELRAPDADAVAAVPRLLAEEEVSTQAPAPTLAQWIAELGELLRNRMLAALDWVPGRGIAETVFFVLLGVGAALLIAFVVAVLLRRRAAVPDPRDEAGGMAVPASAAAPPDAAHWRARLERCLAANDRTGALEALWSWLLSWLAGEAADVRPLAGRRLAREAGRPDLLPLIRRLEAASYGRSATGIAGLRELATRVEAVTGAGG